VRAIGRSRSRRTLEAILARHFARERFTLVLMAMLAGITLSLAAVGVYGMLSCAVSQRRARDRR
jgi:formate/nitrite transporter FocA (FNT family)